MEQGKSFNNPDVAAFISIHKQEATDHKNKFSELTTEDSLKDGDKTARSFSPTEDHSGCGKYSLADASEPDVHGIGGHPFVREVSRKDHEKLSDQTGEQYMDEGSEMDLDYLAFLFPDISEDFLAKVYSVNGGDLDDSVDMLKALEGSHTLDLPQGLPDSLDNSDDSERKYAAEGSSFDSID